MICILSHFFFSFILLELLFVSDSPKFHETETDHSDQGNQGFIFLTSQARLEVETLGQVGGTTMRTKDLRCYFYLLRLKCCHMVMVARWSVPYGHIPKRNWGRTKGERHHGNTSPSSSGFFVHPTGWHWVIQQT